MLGTSIRTQIRFSLLNLNTWFFIQTKMTVKQVFDLDSWFRLLRNISSLWHRFCFIHCSVNTCYNVPVPLKQDDNAYKVLISSKYIGLWLVAMLFNATFNNISAISWRSVLLVEETGVPEETHRSVASCWQTKCIVLR
jgi:hypothetical protein